MGTERLQTKHGIMRSLDGPFTQSPSPNPQHSPESPLLNPRGSGGSSWSPSINPRGSALSTQSSAFCLHHPTLFPSLSPQHNTQPSPLTPQELFLDLSTELLRQGQSVRFQAPGLSMHPTIKEGETITVVPVASFDIKRGDILLYLAGTKAIAHRVVSIKRGKGDPSTQSSRLSPQHLFILRGDASATCDDPVKTQQVLGKVVSVERHDRSIDLYSKKARMLRIARACTSRLKKLILRILKANKGVGLTFGGLQ